VDVEQRFGARGVLDDAVAHPFGRGVFGQAGGQLRGGAAIQRRGDYAASGKEQEFASSGGILERLSHRIVDRITGRQHVEQNTSLRRLHVDGGKDGLIQASLTHEKDGSL